MLKRSSKLPGFPDMHGLAPYAASDASSRGRRHDEPPPAHRTEFQRDRDRIVHSGAFRRLEYKTQVFVNHEGDMFRTRLTHSMEVAQLARTVARELGLNEDLTEAIALAHDLGHAPFGHAGQDALNESMRLFGGFEHNLQSLRVVDLLEERYARFDGLNLTFEAREGILKHCSRANARELGELGKRFLKRQQSSLEAQLADISDAIAYNNHDIDDALRAQLITLDALQDVKIYRDHHATMLARWPGISQRRVVHEVIRSVINHQLEDLIKTSHEAIVSASPRDIEDVRRCPPLIKFSDTMNFQHDELKHFLRENVYRHYRVQRMSQKAQRLLRQLFEAFNNDPLMLPPEARSWCDQLEAADPKNGRARAVVDYIAGMTDRFAIAEFERVFTPGVLT